MEPLLMQSYATLFFVSFVLCIIIILASGYGFSRRDEVDKAAIQSAHTAIPNSLNGYPKRHENRPQRPEEFPGRSKRYPERSEFEPS